MSDLYNKIGSKILDESFESKVKEMMGYDDAVVKKIAKMISLQDYIEANHALSGGDSATLSALFGKYQITEDDNPYSSSSAVQAITNDVTGKQSDEPEIPAAADIFSAGEDIKSTQQIGNRTEFETDKGQYLTVSDKPQLNAPIPNKNDAMAEIDRIKELAGIADEDGVTEEAHHTNPANSPMRSAALAGVSKTPSQIKQMLKKPEKPGPKPKKKRP